MMMSVGEDAVADNKSRESNPGPYRPIYERQRRRGLRSNGNRINTLRVRMNPEILSPHNNLQPGGVPPGGERGSC
jgi:hypothetical protein